MRRAKDILILLIFLAIAVRMIWWALEPAMPFIIILLCFIVIFGVIFNRRKIW